MQGSNITHFFVFDLNKPYVYYKEKGDWISLYESFVQDKIVFTPVMKRIFLTSGQRNRTGKNGVCHGFVLNSSYTS